MRLLRRTIGWKIMIPTLLLLDILPVGCATRTTVVAVDIMKPAEVDLGSIRKLAVADFQGTGGPAVSNLVISKLIAGHRYEVLERDRFAQIVAELGLSQSDLVDPSTAAKIGEAAGVDALILGDVDMYQVSDEPAETRLRKRRVVGYRNECSRRGCDEVPVTSTYTISAPTSLRRGYVGVSFRVVKVETGQILAAKTSSRKWKGVNIEDPHPNNATVGPRPQSIILPSPSVILEQLTDEVAADLVGTISSRQIRIAAVWLPVDGVEPALKYLTDGLLKEAQEHLEGMLQRSRTLPAAFYYDLGLVYEVNGRLDDAEAMYKRAAALEPNELFIKAIRDVRQPR